MKTVVCRLDLGQTRIAGYTLYDDATNEFNETTPKEVLRLVGEKQVQGLTLIDGEIKPDLQGFNQMNLMIKSAVGKFRTLHSSNLTRIYSVTKQIVYTDSNTKKFEVVNNHCSRNLVDEDTLMAMLKVVAVAGVRMIPSTDPYAEADAVEIEVFAPTEFVSTKAPRKASSLIISVGEVLNNPNSTASEISAIIENQEKSMNEATATESDNIDDVIFHDPVENTDTESIPVGDVVEVPTAPKVNKPTTRTKRNKTKSNKEGV